MKRYIFLLLAAFIAVCQGVNAQSLTATGTVVDSNHEPLIGATVRIVGQQGSGSITDLRGQFSLDTNQGAILEISYVGYLTKQVKAGKDLRIILTEDANVLDETVIVGVGYGTMRKSDLTGAIASISAKDMKQGVITSTEQLLQGKVAGLSVIQSSGAPEAGASIRLRGGTSLSASNGPLVVVDGIPGVDINSVQPNEIVSMDILKDASAAAIYGSRGANGVIIVTTNRQGGDVEQSTMQYNGYVAFATASKKLDLLFANQWRGYVRERQLLSANDYGASDDYQDALLRTAISHSHNFSFSNSKKNSGYRASITYNNNQGVIERSSMNRLAGSLTAYQTGWQGRLRIDEGINANFDNWHPVDTRIFERMTNVNPTFPIYNPDGSFAQQPGVNTENPVELNTNRDDDQKRHRFLAYAKVELDIIDGLKYTVNGSYEQNATNNGVYKPTYARLEGQSMSGWGQRTFGNYTNKQLETYLTFDKQIAELHRLNLMAGYSYLNNVYDGFGAQRSGFDTDKFLYNNLAAGTDFKQGDVYSYKGEATLISFFGRANYTYAEKYMATATIRRDGSSRFGDNHKWGVFPSVSLAWRISNEKFMEGTNGWLDNLKLRAGFGITGNQDGIGEYKSLPTIGIAGITKNADGTWKNTYAQNQNPNPNLKWEETAQWNIGLDFSMFNRLHGSLELYLKKTSDLLWTYPVPQPPYPFGTMLANVGDMENKGFELTLGYNAIRTNDLTLDVNASLSYNHQEITKLSNDQYEAVGLQAGSLHGLAGMSNMYAQTIREGYPAGTFWGPRCSGIDADGHYIIDKGPNDEGYYLGSAQPKWNVGLSISGSYKNFDFSVAGYGMFGQKVLNATRMVLFDPNRFPAENVLDDAMTSGITEAPVYSDYFIENGSFFRLQSLTLGYSLPKPQLFGLSRLRVYVTGENLLCLTGYKGLDPEVQIPDNVLSDPGIDKFNSYPRPRTVSVGINIGF